MANERFFSFLLFYLLSLSLSSLERRRRHVTLSYRNDSETICIKKQSLNECRQSREMERRRNNGNGIRENSKYGQMATETIDRSLSVCCARDQMCHHKHRHFSMKNCCPSHSHHNSLMYIARSFTTG
jgi:hypothetical protein